MTYLELVNDVLLRLREQTVTTVNLTTYSQLIGKFVNDSKRQIEDAYDEPLLVETGVELLVSTDVPLLLGQPVLEGSDPQVMLRWSDDGGHTWSKEHWRSMGLLGASQTRVIWRRLGMTNKLRDRVYEVSGTAPVKVAIMGAELTVSGTSG